MLLTDRALIVIAFGGNALLQKDDLGTVDEQRHRAERAAEWLTELVAGGARLLLVHGNGPQVGQVLIQMEEAATKVPPATLDVAVAETEGSMGFLLELALRNRLRQGAVPAEVSTVLSLVVVDGDDPGFRQPSKPIGPFFSRYRAEMLHRHHGWAVVEDAGRGWRKVVSSPRPLALVDLEAVRLLLAAGHVVIAGGGGGIPVVREASGELTGVEAVIDKDYTAALYARELDADLLVILTGVERVMQGFGTPAARPLATMTTPEAEALLAAGEFPPGSMGPKIRAAVEFVTATGRRALITDVEHLHAALAGEGGTLVVPPTPGMAADG